jgi:hypothetical protein
MPDAPRNATKRDASLRSAHAVHLDDAPLAQAIRNSRWGVSHLRFHSMREPNTV